MDEPLAPHLVRPDDLGRIRVRNHRCRKRLRSAFLEHVQEGLWKKPAKDATLCERQSASNGRVSATAKGQVSGRVPSSGVGNAKLKNEGVGRCFE